MKFHKNSLIFRLFAGILCFMVPINLILFGYSIFARYAIWNQSHENYSDYVNLIGKQIDHDLEEIQQYITNIYFVDTGFQQMYQSDDQNVRYLAGAEITSKAYDYIRLYENPMLLFVTSQDLSIPAASTYTSGSSESRIALSDFIHELSKSPGQYPCDTFFLHNLNDHYYIIFYKENRQNYIGVIIPMDDLLTTLDFDNDPMAVVYFCDENGNILSDQSQEYTRSKQVMHTCTDLTPEGLYLAVDVPSEYVVGGLARLQFFSICILVISILVMAAYTLFTSRQIRRPLDRLKKTILEIQGGNLDKKISTENTVDEIAEVYDTFNTFMDHITDLKMRAYEEKLEKQQTQLQYLRLQLRPHFFLNSLKSIYALAQRNEMGSIQDYVLCLSEHYRFLIYDTENTIELRDELAHTQNYIQLQRIGYNLEINCQVQISSGAAQIKVPALILQTFVENSIKYAVMPDQALQIHISAQTHEIDEQNFLNLTVTDNGPGYSKTMLDEIADNEETFYLHHKGLGNLMRRLKLIYSGDASFYIYNLPEKGAAVDILLPIKQQEG